MERGIEGAGCLMGLVVVFGLVALVVAGVPLLAERVGDARAERLEAQASLVRAQSQAEHQASLDHRHELEVYAITLAGLRAGRRLPDGVVLVMAVGAAVCGVLLVIVLWLVLMLRRVSLWE